MAALAPELAPKPSSVIEQVAISKVPLEVSECTRPCDPLMEFVLKKAKCDQSIDINRCFMKARPEFRRHACWVKPGRPARRSKPGGR